MFNTRRATTKAQARRRLIRDSPHTSSPATSLLASLSAKSGVEINFMRLRSRQRSRETETGVEIEIAIAIEIAMKKEVALIRYILFLRLIELAGRNLHRS